MELTAEQKEAVRQWVATGASIAEVQKRLDDDFSVALTYMEARFLIDDLDLRLKDSEKISVHTDLGGDAGTAPPSAPPNPPAPDPDPGSAHAIEPESAGTGSVAIEVDKITRPGMVVSGGVVFSDGVRATWALDQFGRLALDPGKSGYQPTTEDVEAFQQELSKALQKQGF